MKKTIIEAVEENRVKRAMGLALIRRSSPSPLD
jgi:hypothetical protein